GRFFKNPCRGLSRNFEDDTITKDCVLRCRTVRKGTLRVTGAFLEDRLFREEAVTEVRVPGRDGQRRSLGKPRSFGERHRLMNRSAPLPLEVLESRVLLSSGLSPRLVEAIVARFPTAPILVVPAAIQPRSPSALPLDPATGL